MSDIDDLIEYSEPRETVLVRAKVDFSGVKEDDTSRHAGYAEVMATNEGPCGETAFSIALGSSRNYDALCGSEIELRALMVAIARVLAGANPKHKAPT